MKQLILVLFVLISQNVYSQSNIKRKPLTVDGNEFESFEVSKINAERHIQIEDSIEKVQVDSILLAEEELMLIADTIGFNPTEIDTIEWRILYDGENTDFELTKEEIWKKADSKIPHINRTSEDYIKLAKSCSNTRDGHYLAIYFYTKAIDKNNNCFECYFNRALRNQNIEAKEAMLDFKKASKITPTCYICFKEIAGNYLYSESNKNYPLARSYYYKALKVLKCETDEDFDSQRFIIDDIGMTWVYEYGTNDRGVLKNRKVRLHIWDSLVKATNLTRYYKERASLKGDEEIRDFQGSLIDYLYVMKNQKYYDTEVTWAIAANYFELGNYFEAIKYYNEVIGHKLNLKMDRFVIEKLMRLYTAKGDCKMNLQDYRGGIEDYQNALNYCLSLNEKNNIYILLLYSNIGKAKILINEYESAKIELLKAIEFEGVVYNIVNKEVVKNFDLAYAYYLLGAANYKMYEGNSIRSYKEDACLAWSKAGDLGNKEAYTNIKDYCNN